MTRSDLKTILLRYATWLSGNDSGQNAAIQLAHEQILQQFGLGEPTEVSLSTTVDVAYINTKAVSPKIMTILGCSIVVGGDTIPLEPMNYTEYRQAKFRRRNDQSGTPTHYCWEAGNLYLWPTPDTTGTNNIKLDTMSMYGASYDMADNADTVHPDIIVPDIIAYKAAVNECKAAAQTTTGFKEALPALRASMKELSLWLANKRREYTPDVRVDSYKYRRY